MKLGIAATSLGGGFFGGIMVGYALKNVAKLIAILFGMCLARLAYHDKDTPDFRKSYKDRIYMIYMKYKIMIAAFPFLLLGVAGATNQALGINFISGLRSIIEYWTWFNTICDYHYTFSIKI